VRGFQIINGAQTVFNVYEAYKKAEDKQKFIDENSYISLRVLTSGGSDFDLKVTRYTNSQNPVQERDFHANDDVQIRIQSDFLKHTKYWYERRRGEFRKKVPGITIIKNEDLAQTYLAYFFNDPFSAKQSKKHLFLSKTLNPRGFYELIFNEFTKFEDLLISYYLHRFIDSKRKEFKRKIANIDTQNLKEGEDSLLKYIFIQYATFEIMALFKWLFLKVYEENVKSANNLIINQFEDGNYEMFNKCYDYISKFIFDDIQIKKNKDSKIVDSVLFKSKDYYPTIKNMFDEQLTLDSEMVKSFKS
jgi:hypothetical protein